MSHVNMRYCCACALSVSDYTNLALRRHGDIINAEAVNKFLLGNVPQFLTCMAETMQKQAATNHLAARRFGKVLDAVTVPRHMKDTVLYLDSAGFQIQNGFIAPEYLLDYAADYYHFIQTNADGLGYAFTLDLTPGTKVSVFSSAREMYEMNRVSLETASALPQDLRNKVLAVTQFRGPVLYATFRRLLFEEGRAARFQRFAVGGLAVSSRSSKPLPCFPYVIPLSDVLMHANARNMAELHFHVLGNAERHDVLAHCLVERHVWRKHGIRLRITHDSSTVFKKVTKERSIWLPDLVNHSFHDVNIASNHLYLVDPGHGSRVDHVYQAINNALLPYGLGPFSDAKHPLYEGSRATTLGNFLPMMLMLNVYARLDEWCEQAADALYPYYAAGQVGEFEHGVATTLLRLGARNSVEEAFVIARALTKSLDMLTSPDLDRCTYLVNRHLAAQEHPSIRRTPVYR